MIQSFKRAAFSAIAAGERIVRTPNGGLPSLDADALRAIRNFLIPLSHPFLGAAVHETALVEALRSAVPDARIIVAGSGVAAEVYRHHPGVTRLQTAPNPNQNFRGAVRAYRKAALSFGGEPCCALFTAWNGRSRAVLAVMTGIRSVRAGFALDAALAHLALRYDQGRSQIANNLRLPALLGHAVPAELEPRVYFSESDLEHARALLAVDTQRPTAVFITRTSGGQPTRWPDERFVEVARHLMDRHGCRVLLPGTSQDAASLAELAKRIGPNALSVAGRTSIPQLAAVCALSDIAVAVDTGAMHVARAQELPLAIIAPAWQDSVEWMPLGKPWARILKGPWFPSPPPPDYAIEEVRVEMAVSAVDELLRLFPPSDSSREKRVRRSLAA